MYKCDNCDYKSARMWCINRHSLNRHGTNHIKEQSTQIQAGFGSVVTSTTHIPIEKHNEALDLIHKLKALWRNSKKEKIAYEKLQEEHRLVQEYRREDGEHTLAIITYLENVLNANNIRYNLDLA